MICVPLAVGDNRLGVMQLLNKQGGNYTTRDVLLLEQDAALASGLQAVKQRLRADMLSVLRTDALAWMARSAPERFELVLLDPPFQGTHLLPAVAAAGPLVVPGGFLYVESASPLAEPPAKHSLHRRLKAGAVHAQLWQRQA